VIYFFRRGPEARSCETRLNPDGPGYQLVISASDTTLTETFAALPDLLAREHELLHAWRLEGWREVGPPTPTPGDTWSGP
jgi:hypothetical protein